jgi:hypothetical protein
MRGFRVHFWVEKGTGIGCRCNSFRKGRLMGGTCNRVVLMSRSDIRDMLDCACGSLFGSIATAFGM